IAAGTVRREDLFIVTKLMPSNQGEKAYDAMLESLEKLQLDYIDLILVHWPGASGTPPESEENRVQRDKSWQACERLYREKKVRAIGVSNYTAKHLAAMCDPASGVAIPPQCNQIEWHPSLVQEEIHAFCAKHNIVVTAYSP
ncbi:Aldo/keto reductase, partial [Caulochytrium protostelioides]